MEQKESLEILNKCLDELKGMSQDEFDKKCERLQLNEDIEFFNKCINKDNFKIII